MTKDNKVVGVFRGDKCSIYVNDEYIGACWKLEHSGVASDNDNKQMYKSNDTTMWFSFVRYE